MDARWLLKQYRDVRAKGLQETIRKLRTLAAYLAFLAGFPFLLLAVVCLRLVRPWLVVRLGILFSNRLGHFSLHPEIYLSGLDCGLGCPEKPFVDLWCFASRVRNQQLAKMWQRTMHIWPRWVIWPLFRANALLPGSEIHCIPHPDFNLAFRTDCLAKNVLARTKSHLRFSVTEEEEGYGCLEAIGVARGQPFICFHGRDSSYLATEFGGDYSYHDYRDVTIHNYLPAVEELTRRGYVAIRMGSIVRDRLVTSNPKVIDYAKSHHRSDFMDMFLSAKCDFFLSSGSGAFCPSMAFRRPQVIVSASPFVTVLDLDSDILFIPKKYRRTGDGRDLTCREIFASEAYRFNHTHCFKDAGIELVESSPEEILNVIIEGEERYRGTWIAAPEDDELQRRFWSFCPKELHPGPIQSRIGASFLRKNRHLLDPLG
jgi:putative glycosyltransferase (TIGR04372 family)